MSRPLRIEYENAYYHVMNRGAGQRTIFHDDDYYRAFLKTLSEAHERFSIEIYAYCLMGNHYHLLVKTPEANLQRAMRHINGVYTQRYNRLYSTDGSLFRGRYKAILVDADAYLLQLSRYIHRNPIEAGMVSRLSDYPWSSYVAYLANSARSFEKPWLQIGDVMAQLNAKRALGAKYRNFVESDAPDQVIESFYGKERLAPCFGDEDFISEAKLKAKLGHNEVNRSDLTILRPKLEQIVKVVSDSYGRTADEILRCSKGPGARNEPRLVAMYLCQRVAGMRLNDIAEAFSLQHYGGVSNAIWRVKSEMEVSTKLTKTIKSIINRLDP